MTTCFIHCMLLNHCVFMIVFSLKKWMKNEEVARQQIQCDRPGLHSVATNSGFTWLSTYLAVVLAQAWWQLPRRAPRRLHRSRSSLFHVVPAGVCDRPPVRGPWPPAAPEGWRWRAVGAGAPRRASEGPCFPTSLPRSRCSRRWRDWLHYTVDDACEASQICLVHAAPALRRKLKRYCTKSIFSCRNITIFNKNSPALFDEKSHNIPFD